MKLWEVAKLDRAQAAKLQERYELPSILAMLLQIRSITDSKAIEDFLFNESEIAFPYDIKDMDKAVRRIKKSIDNDELICVYGDYDADGVTSTTLMYSYLETIGANVIYYIPSRESEGYGMNKSAIDKLKSKGVGLIVTVDNGIAAIDEIAYANTLGIDTVVTDHHQPLEVLPNAYAVVDLHQKDCNSKFKNLSGVGVAFKTIMAIEGDECDVNMLLDNYSDLLCIGTIGDIVELKGENRVFVKRGIESLNNTDRVGMDALLQSSGLSGKPLTAGKVSFTIVPRINAVGRLGMSHKSVELLLTEDYEQACIMAETLCEDNTERQNIEKEILNKINEKIISDSSLLLDKVLVISGEGWHQGVIGIVASRVKEATGKPVIIISDDGENAKASGRSVEGFSLCDAVFACSDLLTHCGGHPMAVGLSLKSENISLFRKKINEYATQFDVMPFDKLKIDCKLNPAGINVELVKSLSYLQPYGAGNPTPLFGLYNMTLVNIIPLKNNTHLKLVLKRDETVINAMMFFTSSQQFPYKTGDILDLAVTLDNNEYNGTMTVSIVVKDIKPNNINSEKILTSQRNYENFRNGKILSQEQIKDILPERNDFALLYRFLKQNNGYDFSLETLVFKLDNMLSFGKIKVIIEAMRELGLLVVKEGLEQTNITLIDVKEKVVLESAQIIKSLRMCYCE